MMIFQIKRRLDAAAILILALLVLSGCDTHVMQSPESLFVDVTENCINLTWEPVADATGYRVYRKISDQPDFRFITDTQETSYTDILPEVGQSYDYQVTALGPGGESAGTIYTAFVENAGNVSVPAPEITSVTRLDAATNVIFFTDENTDCRYEIQRLEASGKWITIGTTEERFYYDMATAESDGDTYKVRAIKSVDIWAESEIAQEGLNEKSIFGVPVLMYHEFVTQEDLDNGIAFDEYAIYAHEFEHDLQWLQENGYTTITVHQLAEYLQGQGEMPEKPVILTIDDGKLGVYKNAYPLLQKYDMKAVLAVIGEEIHAATIAPELRASNPAPYCTWEELAEMSASGYMEIASHSYGCHIYQHDGRVGADCGDTDTMSDFRMDAYKDFRQQQECFESYDIPVAVTFAYPYSARSVPADEVWIQCGYQMLLGGNMESVRTSRTNYFIQEAGLNSHSSLLRRIARMHGTPIEDYIG